MNARRLRLAVVCLTLLVPSVARADNTTAPNAYSIMAGATASETRVNDADPERWYKFIAVAGRSYCSETQGGVDFDVSSTAFGIDTQVTIYQSDATTVITTNDQAGTEPRATDLSRACWIAPLSSPTYIKVSRFFAGDAFNVRVRLVETSLFSPWYFVGGDYGAFTVIRNTTDTSLIYRINWRNGAGAIVGFAFAALPPNAGVFFNARDIPGILPSNTNGTVEIVHEGAPGAIVANTTVISGTTGLSFDAGFTTRPVW
jgi:hypothetical protein